MGLQETRFARIKTYQRSKHLCHKASPLNASFSSQDHMDSFTGLAGVALLITQTCPVRDLRDVTLSHASSPDILSRYLLVQRFVDSVATYIHIVYAHVQSGQRPQFFNNLPRNFDGGAHHIVMGDFNSVLSSQVDQARWQYRSRLQGRDELLDWMNDLHCELLAIAASFFSRIHKSNWYLSNRLRFRELSAFSLGIPRYFPWFSCQIWYWEHIGLSFRLGSAYVKPPVWASWMCPVW